MKFTLCLALALGIPQENPTSIQKLIESLGDSDLERRDAACVSLRARIKEALPLLRIASAEAADLQVRTTASSLIAPVSAGAVLWKYECTHGGDLIVPIQIVDRTDDAIFVICGCSGSPLVALAISTGAKKWQSSAGNGFATHYAIHGKEGIAFATVNTGPDRVVAIDLDTGKDRWTLEGKKGLHRPVASGDRVFIGGGDGIRGLDLKTGAVRWHFPVDQWVSTPAIADKIVLGAGYDSKVHAIDRETGKQLWEYAASGKLSPVAVSGDAAYVGDQDHVIAIKLADGAKLWHCDVKGVSHDAPRVVDRTLYYSSRCQGPPAKGGGTSTLTRCYAIDAATGEILADRDKPCLPPSGHRWEPAKEDFQAVDSETGVDLPAGKPCALPGCNGVHRVAAKKLRVGEDEITLFSAPDGRLSTRHSLGDRTGPLIVMLAGFPVYSGRHYAGPRRSIVACVRSVDLDRE